MLGALGRAAHRAALARRHGRPARPARRCWPRPRPPRPGVPGGQRAGAAVPPRARRGDARPVALDAGHGRRPRPRRRSRRSGPPAPSTCRASCPPRRSCSPRSGSTCGLADDRRRRTGGAVRAPSSSTSARAASTGASTPRACSRTPSTARPAAVLVLFGALDATPSRTQDPPSPATSTCCSSAAPGTLGHHAGQIAFPGGRLEPSDAGPRGGGAPRGRRGGRARRVRRRGARHPAAAARAGEQPPGHPRAGLVDPPVAGRRRRPRRDGRRVPRPRGGPARPGEPGERRAHRAGAGPSARPRSRSTACSSGASPGSCSPGCSTPSAGRCPTTCTASVSAR